MERHKVTPLIETKVHHRMQAWNVADVVEQSSKVQQNPLLHSSCAGQQNPWFHASDHAIFSTIEREDDIFGGLSDINHHHHHLTLEKPPISSSFVPRSEITGEKGRGESSGTKRELQQIQQAPTESIELVRANERRKKPPRPRQTRKTSAEMHNEYERKRRDRINEKIRTLRDLMPTCSSSHAASILEHAIEYLKAMKLQIQIMNMCRTAMYQYQYPWMTAAPFQPGVVSPFLSFARPSPGTSSVYSSGFPLQSVSVPSSNLDSSPSSGGGDNVPVPQMQVPSISSHPLLSALLLCANDGGSSANNLGNSLPNVNQNML